MTSFDLLSCSTSFQHSPWALTVKVHTFIAEFTAPPGFKRLLMLMIKNGCWWIDTEPSWAGFRSWRQAHYSSNLAGSGSFSQITNTAISLLIPAGPCFSNPSDRHEAVKHWVMSVRTNNDEKWHTGAAFTTESFSSLRRFSGTVLFPSLRFTQLYCGELVNWSQSW